jgi:galactosylgalactosylxylosylprotein 3-beta-glucuronosyltransferase 1
MCVQETTFIEQLVADESQMEGLPPGCSKVMVWHLHLEAASELLYPSGWTLKLPLTANLPLQQDA